MKMRNETGFLCAVVFHLSGSVHFLMWLEAWMYAWSRRTTPKDKINVVLSSVDCPHDYLQDQILWFCPYEMCCTHVV